MTVDASIATLDEDESLEPPDSTLKAVLGATVTLIALVVVWEVLVRQFEVPGWLLPSPSSICRSNPRNPTWISACSQACS